MESKSSLTRKEFITLTFTLIGAAGAAAAAACSSSSSSTPDGGGGACHDPLPETQVADATGHTHTVTVAASLLSSTTDQTLMTSTTGGHMHTVTLSVANLAAIKAGGNATVTSSSAGTPAHVHSYTVSCT